MSIKHAIWKVGPQPSPLGVPNLATEQSLEEMIVADPRIRQLFKASRPPNR
jgi:hypothetical protein